MLLLQYWLIWLRVVDNRRDLMAISGLSEGFVIFFCVDIWVFRRSTDTLLLLMFSFVVFIIIPFVIRIIICFLLIQLALCLTARLVPIRRCLWWAGRTFLTWSVPPLSKGCTHSGTSPGPAPPRPHLHRRWMSAVFLLYLQLLLVFLLLNIFLVIL